MNNREQKSMGMNGCAYPHAFFNADQAIFCYNIKLF